MRRLQLLDIFLLVFFVPLWLLCFAAHLHKVVHGEIIRASVYVSTSASSDAYPIVRGFRPGIEPEITHVAIGDHLLRVGETDLRGLGPFGFTVRVYSTADAQLRVPLVILRDSVQQSTTLQLTPLASPWGTVPLTLGFAVTAVLALLYAPGSRLARAFFLASIVYSLHWTYCYGEAYLRTYGWMLIFSLSALVMFPLMLRVMLLIPEEIAPTGARVPSWPWVFTVFGPITTSLRFGVPSLSPQLALRLNFLVTVVLIVTLLGVLTVGYRRTGPIGRRQFKWVMFGVYIGTLPVLIVDALGAFSPGDFHDLHDLAVSALVLIPFCVFMAIVRSNLFDIDRLISATSAYSILLALGLLGTVLFAPRFVQAASKVVNVSPTSGHVVVGSVLLVVLAPLQWRLRQRIEQRFFAAHYAFVQGVQTLLEEIAAHANTHDALTLVGERLDALLEPESCVVYLREENVYRPVFVRGHLSAPLVLVGSLLAGALQTLGKTQDMQRWRRSVRLYLEEENRATLDRLDIALGFPFGSSSAPLGFFCLGAKRSGDVYTPSEVRILAELTEQVTEALQKYLPEEERETLREVREE